MIDGAASAPLDVGPGTLEPGEALVVQITDCHLGADPAARLRGVATRASLAAVLERAQPLLKQASLLLATGDLSHDGSAESYRALRQALRPVRAPLLCLPGNHDHPARLADHCTGELSPVRIGAWLVVGLDSCQPGREGGRLAARALDELEHTLAAAPDRPTLLCLHHPPLPVGSPWLDAIGLAEPEALLERVRAHPQVRAVVCGHIHQVLDAELGSARFLGTPSTCVQFRPATREPETDTELPGYRWLVLGADGALRTGIDRIGSWPAGCEPLAGG